MSVARLHTWRYRRSPSEPSFWVAWVEASGESQTRLARDVDTGDGEPELSKAASCAIVAAAELV